MSTNFYFHTREKERRDKWFSNGEYALTDFPEFGYLIHLAMTSGGWVPLFQAHKKVSSVADIKRIYEDGGFKIVDAYGKEYDWQAFEKRVVDFGHVWEGAHSHLEYEKNSQYRHMYFRDEEGYEFSREEFC